MELKFFSLTDFSVPLNLRRMEKLIEYLNAARGRRKALAQQIGCSPSAISMWERVPAERVRDVSEATGLSMTVLRPDLFGREPEAAE